MRAASFYAFLLFLLTSSSWLKNDLDVSPQPQAEGNLERNRSRKERHNTERNENELIKKKFLLLFVDLQ